MNSVSRFSNRVESYALHRPRYPQAVVDCLVQHCDLTPASMVADVGAGTGILTDLLLQYGCTVYAVEPNAAMRAVAERELAPFSNFQSVDGRAEGTTLPGYSVDLITAGQAFHWFDPKPTRAEFLRILRPNGWVALVWNSRRTGGNSFLNDYQQLLEDFGTDYRVVDHKFVVDDSSLEHFFGSSGFILHEFPNYQVLDWEGLVGRLTSTSYVPAPDNASYPAMLDRLRAIFAANVADGAVVMEYDTHLYIGRLA